MLILQITLIIIFNTGVQLEIGEYTATTIPPFQHMNISA